METREKRCGSCLYLNYKGRGNNLCEVYSFSRWQSDKGCINWKEKHEAEKGIKNRGEAATGTGSRD